MFKYTIIDSDSKVALAAVTDLMGPRAVARELDKPELRWVGDRSRGEAAAIIADFTGGTITKKSANSQLEKAFLKIRRS